MEGYSVTEAASVLGVPTERVWELLARGVLAGTPDGDTGMRVYLQPRPAPPPREEKQPNGNGGRAEPERELSPFRELLTEFRNLTERYGQALLALGEARGEVAALRSRVDLLEARMDLRLPATGAAAPPTGWTSATMPAAEERTVMPTARVDRAAPDAPERADVDEEEEERRARRRGPRRATESFAEALARAQDPSIPELPAGRDAAALAALRAETDAGDLGLARDLPGTDPVPVAEEAAPRQVEAVAEAEPPAVDEVESPPAEAASVDAAEEVAPRQVEAVAEAEPPAVDEVESPPAEAAPVEAAGQLPSPAAEAAPTGSVDQAEGRDAIPGEAEATEPRESAREEVHAAAATEGDRVAEAEVVAERAPDIVTGEAETPAHTDERAAAEPLEWDSERYTTDIEEPDWFVGEAFETGGAASAEPDEVAGAASVPRADAAQLEPPEEVEPPQPVEERSRRAQELTDEARVVWYGAQANEASGADEMEVASSSPRPAAAPARPSALPGSTELDEALSALNALTRTGTAPDAGLNRAEQHRAEQHPTAARGDDERESAGWPGPSGASSAAAWPAPGPTRGTSTTGPASRAYRRLRRIFPS